MQWLCAYDITNSQWCRTDGCLVALSTFPSPPVNIQANSGGEGQHKDEDGRIGRAGGGFLIVACIFVHLCAYLYS